MGDRRALSVLCTSRTPSQHGNPYVKLLSDSLPDSVDYVFFTWRMALFGSYDVVHAHWPEGLMHGSSHLRRLVKRTLFLAWLIRLRMSGTRIVQTIHNRKPHEGGGWAQERLLQLFADQVQGWITLNDSTASPDESRTLRSLHGLYPVGPKSRSHPRNLLAFGAIREYKRTVELVRAYAASASDRRLVVMGQPRGRYGDIAVTTARDSGCIVKPGPYTEEDLDRELARSACVVMASLGTENSGVAMRALSAGVPVCAVKSDALTALASQVGSKWLRLVESSEPAALFRGLEEWLETFRSGETPDLSDFSWPEIGASTARFLAVGIDSARVL